MRPILAPSRQIPAKMISTIFSGGVMGLGSLLEDIITALCIEILYCSLARLQAKEVLASWD